MESEIELVERLRARACGPFKPSNLHNEAADLITTLQARIERLEEAGEGLATCFRGPLSETSHSALTEWQAARNGRESA